MPAVPVAVLIKSKIIDIKKEFLTNPSIADAIVQIVSAAGGRVDLEALKRELQKPNSMNESRTITKNEIRRIVRDELNKIT